MLEPVKLVLHLILGHEMYFYSKNLLPTYNSIVLGNVYLCSKLDAVRWLFNLVVHASFWDLSQISNWSMARLTSKLWHFSVPINPSLADFLMVAFFTYSQFEMILYSSPSKYFRLSNTISSTRTCNSFSLLKHCLF